MRYAIVAVVALCVGVVAGAFVLNKRLGPQLAELGGQYETLSDEHKKLLQDYDFATERLDWLESENKNLQQQLAAFNRNGSAETASVDSEEEAISLVTMGKFEETLAGLPVAPSNEATFQMDQAAAGQEKDAPRDDEGVSQVTIVERRRVQEVLQEQYAMSTDATE
ncbi:MAG: hypothetical protein KJ052_15470, partial [Candidatus Hydrogenedentes bacterium]|nr:hypothetical protein [Candidatus Hydrogenedentota bacterium]